MIVLLVLAQRPEALLRAEFWRSVLLSWAVVAFIAILVLPRDTSPSTFRRVPEFHAVLGTVSWQWLLPIGLSVLVVSALVFRAHPPRGILGIVVGSGLTVLAVSRRQRVRRVRPNEEA